MISPDDYIDFFQREYLDYFVSNGGACVRFCVLNDDQSSSFLSRICDYGNNHKYQVIAIDASSTKFQMIEQIFFSIACQIDWQGLANRRAREAAEAAGYPVPNESEDLSVAALAFYYAMDEKELKRDINQQLQHMIFGDFAMVQEFRIAMLRLCQYELRTGQVSDAERDSIYAWLTGSLRQMSLLKSARIFRKIARHNGRQMLFSLSNWLVKGGYSGLIVQLDIRQFTKTRAKGGEEFSGIFYTRSAVIDAYESLRQLIDNTDEFSNLAVIVICNSEFLTDTARGVSSYQALKLRIFDEVRDKRLDNPYAALVRIGTSNDPLNQITDHFTPATTS